MSPLLQRVFKGTSHSSMEFQMEVEKGKCFLDPKRKVEYSVSKRLFEPGTGLCVLSDGGGAVNKDRRGW